MLFEDSDIKYMETLNSISNWSLSIFMVSYVLFLLLKGWRWLIK